MSVVFEIIDQEALVVEEVTIIEAMVTVITLIEDLGTTETDVVVTNGKDQIMDRLNHANNQL